MPCPRQGRSWKPIGSTAAPLVWPVPRCLRQAPEAPEHEHQHQHRSEMKRERKQADHHDAATIPPHHPTRLSRPAVPTPSSAAPAGSSDGCPGSRRERWRGRTRWRRPGAALSRVTLDAALRLIHRHRVGSSLVLVAIETRQAFPCDPPQGQPCTAYPPKGNRFPRPEAAQRRVGARTTKPSGRPFTLPLLRGG
jgi:hypothetical protein